MNCPECGMQWESRPYICDCGYAFQSPFNATGEDRPMETRRPPRTTSARRGSGPAAATVNGPGASRFAEYCEPDEKPIGGLLTVAVIWLCLLVASGAYTWMMVADTLADQELVNRLNTRGFSALVDFLQTAFWANSFLLVLGGLMLFSIFSLRRYARLLVIFFLVVNIALGYYDFEMTKLLMDARSSRLLQIDEASLVPQLLGRLAANTILLLYFFLSNRVRETLK